MRYLRLRLLPRYLLLRLTSALIAALAFIALALLVSNLHSKMKEPILSLLSGRHLGAAIGQANVNELPHLVFWAWEHPEDLRFIDSRRGQGVAFLARTIELHSLSSGNDPSRDPGVYLRPRLQPLKVAVGTHLIAVVRIESSNDLWHRPVMHALSPGSLTPAPPYSDAQLDLVVKLAEEAAHLPMVEALQIDYDASTSERSFYVSLLQELRARMPKGKPLSITALASWCIWDNWLDRLPPGTIDEAVPMLFRMGPDDLEVASYVKSGKEFPSQLCRSSLGVSTDESFSDALLSGAIEPQSRGWRTKRVYVFSPRPWVKEDADVVTKEVGRWHDD